MTDSNLCPTIFTRNWKIHHVPEDDTLPCLYLLMHQEKIIENTYNKLSNGMFFHEIIPEYAKQLPSLFLGSTNTHNFRVIDIPENNIQSGHKTLSIRQALMASCMDESSIIKIATSIVSWNKRYRFCSGCGNKMNMAKDERAKICLHCNTRCYTHVSPCVIMAVRKGEQIFLARHSQMAPGIYSTLAGFIEPGESAEEAVRREVMEETNITVTNIEYAGSQAWPFPSQLMLGFLCEYESGHIRLNTQELEQGQWYDMQSLPELPSSISIANSLIRKTLDRIQGTS